VNTLGQGWCGKEKLFHEDVNLIASKPNMQLKNVIGLNILTMLQQLVEVVQ